MAGIVAGLSISNHLLSLSIVFMTSLAICCSDSFKAALKNTVTYAFGMALGLLPYLYAKLYIPGAYQKVSDSYTLLTAIERFPKIIFSEIFPSVLGINTLLYPEVSEKVSTFDSLLVPFQYIFIGFLAYLFANRLYLFILRLIRTKWVSFELADVCLGTTAIAILLMSVTKLTLYPRYSLFVVWSFPFIIFFTHKSLPTLLKRAVEIFVVCMLFINLINAKQLYAHWSNENFSEKHAFMPNLEPLYSYFRSNEITHCYTGWWLSYQLIVNSKEKVICSPPFNDRFIGWEQPHYRELVDLNYNTPFIVGVYQHRWLEKDTLQKLLTNENLKFTGKQVGDFFVFDKIKHKDSKQLKIISPNRVSYKNKTLNNLFDKDINTHWTSSEQQFKNQKITIDFGQAQDIYAMRIFTKVKNYAKETPEISIIGIDANGGKKILKKNTHGLPFPIKLDRNQKYQSIDINQLFFGFEKSSVQRISLRIKTPISNANWEISEIQLLTNTDNT